MTRARWIVGACVAALVALYWLNFPTYSHRYRLTISVEADGQVHSGSSVIEIRFRFWPQFVAGLSGGGQYAVDVRGQAVFVDLGAHGALVASLVSYTDQAAVSAQWLALRALNPQPEMSEGSYVVTRERLRELSEAPRRAGLTPDNLPQFVWFKDVVDPATARPVKATDFAAVIGGNASLAIAQVEMTGKPIAVDIDKKLPWYGQLKASATGVLNLQGGFALGDRMFIGGAS